MSRLPIRRTFGIIATAILLSPFCRRTDAGTVQASNNQDTVLTSARHFLDAAYPELFQKGFFLQMTILQPIDESWRNIRKIQFLIDRYDPLSERMLNPPFDPKTGRRLSPPKNVVCQGQIWFTTDGHLDQFAIADCPVDHGKDNRAIRALVQSHPEWSSAQAFDALNRAGAQYGPANKDALVKAIDLKKYEPFLGQFSVESAEFEGLSEPHEGSFAFLHWSVKLEIHLPDGKHDEYSFLFEPFSGKLTQVIHGLFRP